MTNRRPIKKRAKKLPENHDDKNVKSNRLAEDNKEFSERLHLQTVESSWFGDAKNKSRNTNLLISTIRAIEQIAPRDELEGMLVSQMIASHNAAMECFRRSMIQEQTFEGRDNNLRHAEKLTKLYTEQVEALEKYRGKRHHKMTVEHVNVEPGGQAIVGDVHHTSKGFSKKTTNE